MQFDKHLVAHELARSSPEYSAGIGDSIDGGHYEPWGANSRQGT